MLRALLFTVAAAATGAVGACGGNVHVDGSAGGAGPADSTETSATASSTAESSGAGAGGSCPEGTCIVEGVGGCQVPTGPQGNACCQCTDGVCTALCRCAAPDTPIATPDGERAIASLRVGDLVYTVDHAQVVAAPVVATHHTDVGPAHRVVRVRTARGATLEISGGHPTLDGRVFADLRVGDRLDGELLVEVETIPYALERTYDILPASDSGGYFADGVLIGSTLRPAARISPR